MLQDRRNKGFILFVLELIILMIIGGALIYALPIHNFPYGIVFLERAGTLCFALAGVQSIIYMVYWFFYHKAYKGVKYAFIHARMMRKLRCMLLEASSKHTVQEYAGEEKVARLPKIRILISDDMESGKVIIGNSIRFHKLYEEMNISSALGQYVVVEQYLSDDMNSYIYEFERSEIKQLIFKSYDEFKAYCSQCKDNFLFLDKKNKVPLHHTLIVGSTGTGKTYAIYSLLLQALNFSIIPAIYIADPKRSSLYVLGKRVACDSTAGGTGEIVLLLERFYNEMTKREKELQKYLDKKLDSNYKDWGLKAHILIIDEFSSFMSSVSIRDKATKDKVNMYLTNIIQKGRQLGFFMWIIMQKSDSKILPTYLRDNLVFKVVLGQATDTTYQTAFEEYANLPRLKFQPGHGLYSFQGLTRQPRVCSFPRLEFDILRSVSK